MDVRAKQRLSYRVIRLTSAGLVAVLPHVISSVVHKIEDVEKAALELMKY